MSQPNRSSTLERFHRTMDRSSKYVVTLLTAAATSYCTPFDAHSIVVPTFAGMSVVTAVFGKLLKRLINQSRPDGAVKLDPGMPSSHAVALSYLATAAVIGLAHTSHPYQTVLSIAVVLLAWYYAWLRVFLGHHTLPQVAAGAALGCTSACAVYKAMYYGGSVVAHVDHLPLVVKQTIQTVLAVGCTVVMILSFGKWKKEDDSLDRRSNRSKVR